MNKYNNELASCTKLTLKPGFGEFYGGNQVHITRQNDKQLEKNNYKPYLGSGHSFDEPVKEYGQYGRMSDTTRTSHLAQLKRDKDYREKVNMGRMSDTTRISHQEQLKRDKDYREKVNREQVNREKVNREKVNREKVNREQTVQPLQTAASQHEKDNYRLTEDNARLNAENNRLLADKRRLDKRIVVERPEGVASDVRSKKHIEPRIDKKHDDRVVPDDRVVHDRESICVFFTFLFISYIFYILHLMNKQLYYYTGYQ